MLTDIKKALAELDDDSRAGILVAFGKSFSALQPEIDAFLARIERAQAQGISITPEWMFTSGGLRMLELHIRIQLADFGQTAASIITEAQRAASLLAQADLGTYAEALGGEAVKGTGVAIGLMGNGESLLTAFAQLAPRIATAVQASVLDGVKDGLEANQLGLSIQQTVASAATSGLRASTTETMRVYRENLISDFKQNKMLVRGWGWISRLDKHTCIVCILMHGTSHKLSEPFASHPQCRCIPVPRAIVTTFEDFQTGREWFLDKSGVAQERILGKAAYKAYSSGEVKLDDFIARTRSAEWGQGRHVRSLKEILGTKSAAQFYRRAS